MICARVVVAMFAAAALSTPGWVASASAEVPLATALDAARSAYRNRAAAARVEAAQGALAQAAAWPNPNLELRQENLGHDSGWSAEVALPIDFFATLSQPIELGGDRRARRDMAGAELQQAAAEAQAMQRAVELEAMRLYLAVLREREILAATDERRGALQAQIDGLQRRVDEGHVAEADVLKLRTEAARLDADMTRSRLTLRRRLGALAALLAGPDPLSADDLVLPPPLAPPEGDPEALAQAALARQPDVAAAVARQRRSDAAVAFAYAQRVPNPNVTAGYKRTSGADTFVAGVNVALPLFDRNRGALMSAVAEQQATDLDAEALRARRKAEMVAILVAARELAERAARAPQELLAPAEAVRRAARSSFREGVSDVLPLVDAERVYGEAQREALDLRLEAFARSFEAHRLLDAEFRP